MNRCTRLTLLLLLPILLFTGCREDHNPFPPGKVDASLYGTWTLTRIASTDSLHTLDHSEMILTQQGTGFLMDLNREYELDTFYWAVEADQINFTQSNKWFSLRFEKPGLDNLTLIDFRNDPELFYTYVRAEE